MAKQRGRKKGTKIESKSFIKDAILSPFYIKLEDKSFTVFKDNEAQPWGYYIALPNALKAITIFKCSLDKEVTYSLKEYIDTYNQIVNQLLSIIKINEK